MRRPLTVRRTAAALALPLALTGLAACGSDSDAPAGSSQAADPDVEAGEEIEPSEFVDSMQESFEDATTAHVTMTNEGQVGVSAEGDVDYSTEPPSMDLTMENEAMGQEISMVLVDGVMYMQMGAMGDKYIKMDLTDPDSPLGGDLTGQMDPGQALEAMEGAITSVTYEGEDDVDGESLDHYTLLIDTDKMVGDAGAAGAGAAGMPDELVYEVWFDEDGLFRRTSMDMGEKAGSMTMTLSDWGKDVEIEAPPADQVTEMPEMPQMPETPSA